MISASPPLLGAYNGVARVMPGRRCPARHQACQLLCFFTHNKKFFLAKGYATSYKDAYIILSVRSNDRVFAHELSREMVFDAVSTPFYDNVTYNSKTEDIHESLLRHE